MGRKRDRASGFGLLPRMEARPHKGSDKVTYRYHPMGGKPINLGQDKRAAIQKVLDMVKAVPLNEIFSSTAEADAYLDLMQRRVLEAGEDED